MKFLFNWPLMDKMNADAVAYSRSPSCTKIAFSLVRYCVKDTVGVFSFASAIVALQVNLVAPITLLTR